MPASHRRTEAEGEPALRLATRLRLPALGLEGSWAMPGTSLARRVAIEAAECGVSKTATSEVSHG